MFDKVEVGHVFGIPIVLDFSLILMILLWGFHYFTSGNLASISYGVLLVAGVLASILLHEFGHAAADRYYGVRVSHVELNALGGVCYAVGPVPPGRLPNIVILLAGPAVTCALWLTFSQLGALVLAGPAAWGPLAGVDRLGNLFSHLGYLNWYLLLFNLAPSHPLDGGRTLAHLLSAWIGYDRAMRFVAYAGFAVVAWLAWEGLHGAYFALFMAVSLFQANQEALEAHQGPRWRHWN